MALLLDHADRVPSVPINCRRMVDSIEDFDASRVVGRAAQIRCTKLH